MNNGIVCRQNEEKSIKCLAAQRQIYNEVKKFDNVGIVFSVVLPLILSVLQLLWKKKQIFEYCSTNVINSKYVCWNGCKFICNSSKEKCG